jgi:hypothetical protein
VTRATVHIATIVCTVVLVWTRVGDINLVATSEPCGRTMGVAVILSTPVGVIAIQFSSSADLRAVRHNYVVTVAAAVTVYKPYSVSRFNIQFVRTDSGYLALSQSTEVIIGVEYYILRVLHMSTCGEVL